MAYTYLFFHPLRLPLASHELSGETVLPLDDPAAVRSALEEVIPGIRWVSAREGRTEVQGQWMEFFLRPEVGTLGLRCSLRADYQPIVQRLCDELGWLAFDEQPVCYQPHRLPMPA
ncbi:MAG: hypothetical protein JO040_03740 [Gemmatimonadetes bacterium]|nr:hypothetical protein [Gemmatimonadota bacterium]